MMKRKGITPAEVTLLRYILDNQPVTVRQVADYMTEQHGLARTTVLTHMERLRKRHILERTEVDGINQYRATRPPAELLTGLVRDFVDQILGGAVSPLVTYLTQRDDLTEEEIEALEAMVARTEKDENS
jgi:predicted transcriptional regulator